MRKRAHDARIPAVAALTLLTGTIPGSLAALDKLEYLNLEDNQLTGTIPGWLGGLDQIEYLSLQRNQLSGTLPSALASLAGLERLRLDDNQFSGPIPGWLGSLTSLKYLTLAGNPLTGPFPGSLTALSLDAFSLVDPRSTPSVPTQCCRSHRCVRGPDRAVLQEVTHPLRPPVLPVSSQVCEKDVRGTPEVTS